MISAIDRRAKHIRVMVVLRQLGPLRFTAIQKAAGLHAPEVDRILKELAKDGLVLPRTVPARRGANPVEYIVGKKGLIHLGGVEAYRSYFTRHHEVDQRVMDQLDALFA